jgi:hypothetical protein
MPYLIQPAKNIVLLLCLLLLCTATNAQVEFILPNNDSIQIINNVTHVVDANGNVFLLSAENPYYKSGLAQDFTATTIATAKIDNKNKINWAHYPSVLSESDYYNKKAAQIFIWNHNIAIPCNLNMNTQPCANDSNYRYSSRNGMLVLDDAGRTVTDKVFTDDTSCGWHYIFYTYQNMVQNSFTYVYMSTGDGITRVDKRDSSLNRVTFTTAPTQNQSNLIYDTIARSYLTYSNDNIFVYDIVGGLLKTISIRSDTAANYLLKIAYNAEYYVLYFKVLLNGFYSANYAISVFSKNGELVSSAPTAMLNDLILTPDNHIWMLANNISTDTNLQKPVLLMETDLYQNITRQKYIGYPLTNGNALSVNTGDVIITGTTQTVNWKKGQPPSRLYFYREAITDIPIHAAASNCCNEINIFPNPATNIVHITSNSFAATYGAAVGLYNTLGQPVGSYTWKQKSLDMDISGLAKGVYYVQSYNAGKHICIQKLVKL